jgi:glycosyltransferase involved in cell wall biosynthesis
MIVMIDALGVTRIKAGAGVYAKNLIGELAEHYPELSLIVLAQSDDPDMDYGGFPNVTMLRFPSKLFRIFPLRFMLEQVGIPFLLWKHRVQLLHSLHYSFPLVHFGTKQVVTLHDLTFLNMPEVHVRIKVLYFRFFLRAAGRYADTVIFVSESARQDYVRSLGAPRGLTAVVHHGSSSAFRHDLDPKTVESVRNKYGLPTEFLLFVGTIEPRKNLNRLVAAFKPLADEFPGLVLVIAGMKGWMYDQLFKDIRTLGLESRVLFPGFIPEEDKPYLITAAKVFVYPTLYEGFGLPALEALACGTPMVTSNISSLPEVVGKAALLVEPTDEVAISQAIRQLLSDNHLRTKLRQESVPQAAKFNWATTAQRTVEAYLQALRTNSDPL